MQPHPKDDWTRQNPGDSKSNVYTLQNSSWIFQPDQILNIKLVKFTRLLMCQMIDANQRWDVNEAVTWVTKLAEFHPLWIEEPTSPDDILGHASISKVNWFIMFIFRSC